MSFTVVNDFPNDILNETRAPFVSLYQPTHRHRPDNKQDIIRFKNLIRRIEGSLREGYSRRQVDPMMRPFYALGEDVTFWNGALDGLAVLATRDRGVIYKLQRPVPELAVVADSFHVKPLIRVFQSADRYQLLGLNRNEFALYEGNRYGFEELALEPGTPRTIKDVLGDDYTEKYITSGTYAGADGVGAFHGHGGKKDETDKYTRRFFRYVDRFVWEHYSRPSGLPLILVSLAEYHPIFRSISRNTLLMKDGIKVAFDALSIEQLKQNAWETVEPLYLDKTAKLVDRFKAAWSQFSASDDLVQIARAAGRDRVATLLLESDRIVPGKVNPSNGELIRGDLEHWEYDDVLDDLAEIVFNSGGEVVVLPKERMPASTGAAAIFRY